MSAIGNIVGGIGADALGKYNQSVYNQQAALAKRRAEISKATFNQVTKPLIEKQNNREYSNFFVSILKSGVEFREGDSPYLAALEFKVNQATDLAIAEFNADMDFNDQLNQSLLLQAKGAGERFSGQMTRNAEFAKAIGSAASSYNESGSLLGG